MGVQKRACMQVALENIPHHSQHIGVSHCHSNVCHSIASHSSRNKSCRPGARGRYCRRNKLGATVYRSRPFPHRWLGHLPSYSVCSSSRTAMKSIPNNLVIVRLAFLISSFSKNSEKQLSREIISTEINSLSMYTIRCSYFCETESLGFLQAIHTSPLQPVCNRVLVPKLKSLMENG